jgi:Tfp pilus assembly protein PilX
VKSDACTYRTGILRNRDGASILIILIVVAILTLIGNVALHKASADIRTSGAYKKNSQVLYVAEAGVERAKADLAVTTINDLLNGADNDAGTPADNGLFSFGGAVSFGQGIYSVSLRDNDDGDGNQWVDADGKAVLQSLGTMPDGNRKTIELLLEKIDASSETSEAAIKTRGPIAVNGGLIIDGRDHDMNGNLIPGPGVMAVSTRSTFSFGGSADIGGTDAFGINHAPTDDPFEVAAVTEQGVSYWGNPATPEEALGIPVDGGLKKIAQSGIRGSQYVTDPDNLTYPFSGVTYVELSSGAEWKANDNFDGSTGILVVHNSTTDAVMENSNTGTFKGIIIVDDYVHIHNNIYGTIIALTESPSSGNVIGNGNGEVRYSSQAISVAKGYLNSFIDVVAWRELM